MNKQMRNLLSKKYVWSNTLVEVSPNSTHRYQLIDKKTGKFHQWLNVECARTLVSNLSQLEADGFTIFDVDYHDPCPPEVPLSNQFRKNGIRI